MIVDIDNFKNIFTENLPHKPYCTSDFKKGLKIKDKVDAIKEFYIQYNNPSCIKFLVQDCDYVNAFESCSEKLAPQPNLCLLNKSNGHSHLIWGLTTPVYTGQNAHSKPLDFLACVEYALREKVLGDKGFGGLIMKNPLSDQWMAIPGRADLYDLSELADYLDVPSSLPRTATYIGLGRNCTLFDMGRRWAYKNVLQYRINNMKKQFFMDVFHHLKTLNQTFETPLLDNEVEQIAKSIAKWTWKNYTGRLPDDEFSAIQARRGRLGGLQNGVANYDKREQAKAMRATGMSQKAIAEALGIGQGTVSKWLK